MQWLLRNLSNALSLISIFITIYFGVFYVPSWIEDAEKQKFRHEQYAIEQSIKELIYADTPCTYAEIIPLVKASEVNLGKAYPMTIAQILNGVQYSFMNDKFLSLEKRRQMSVEIAQIINSVPKDVYATRNKNKASLSVASWVSIIVSLLLSLLGIYSLYARFRLDKETQEEINNQTLEAEFYTKNEKTGYVFEQDIISVIKNYNGIEGSELFSDSGYDFQFKYQGKEYFVEVKYLSRSKVGLNSLTRFLNNVKGKEGNFWFIYNTELTPMVISRFREFEQKSGNRGYVKLIHAETVKDFKEQLPKLLSNN